MHFLLAKNMLASGKGGGAAANSRPDIAAENGEIRFSGKESSERCIMMLEKRFGLSLSAWLTVLVLFPFICRADWTRTQTIQLQKGWNAVFLEVDPAVDDPDEVFAGLPVDLVATFYGRASSIQYIKDPDEADWKREGWHKWLPPDAPDAFLKNLYRLHANQGYLIRATEAVTWEIVGNAHFSRPRWRPNSFNFTGFFVDPDDKPTFSEFFANSKAHGNSITYYLMDNHWHEVTNPASHIVEPGRAYWVYCRGESDFMGPLDITLPLSGDRLDFQALASTLRIYLKNKSDVPINAQPASLPGKDNGPLVAMSMELRTAIATTLLDDWTANPYGEIEAGAGQTFYLTVRRDRMAAGDYASLLQLTGGGARFFIPVAATVR